MSVFQFQVNSAEDENGNDDMSINERGMETDLRADHVSLSPTHKKPKINRSLTKFLRFFFVLGGNLDEGNNLNENEDGRLTSFLTVM